MVYDIVAPRWKILDTSKKKSPVETVAVDASKNDAPKESVVAAEPVVDAPKKIKEEAVTAETAADAPKKTKEETVATESVGVSEAAEKDTTETAEEDAKEGGGDEGDVEKNGGNTVLVSDWVVILEGKGKKLTFKDLIELKNLISSDGVDSAWKEVFADLGGLGAFTVILSPDAEYNYYFVVGLFLCIVSSSLFS